MQQRLQEDEKSMAHAQFQEFKGRHRTNEIVEGLSHMFGVWRFSEMLREPQTHAVEVIMECD